MASEILKDDLQSQIRNVNVPLTDNEPDEYGAVGSDPVSKLSTALSSGVGLTTEISSTLNSIHSGRDLLNVGYGFLPSGYGQAACFADIAAGLLAYGATNANNRFSDDEAKVASAMLKPFKDAFSLIGDIVLPQDEDASISDMWAQLGPETLDSFSNPLLMFLNTQGQMANNSMNAMLSQFDAGQNNTFYNDFKNITMRSLQKLFLGPDAEGNLLGLFIYAFEFGIPSIDAELYALKELKKLSLSIAEEASNAPIQINLQMPNAATVLNLCEAEEALRISYEKLSKQDVLDRSMLSYAQVKICEAKNIIYDGSIDADFLKRHGANFVGMGGPDSYFKFKAGDISLGKMLPAAVFRAKVDRILRLANNIKAQDDQIVILYGNIVKAVENIKALTNTHIGKLLAPIVLFVKNAVSGVRRDLELTGAGVDSTPKFTGVKVIYDDAGNSIGTEPFETTDVLEFQKATADYITSKEGNVPESELNKRVDAEVQKYYTSYAKQNYDIWSYMSSQTAAYTWLSVLCSIMQKLQPTFNFIDRALSGQSAVMRVIAQVVERFDAGSCAGATDPTRGGQRVIAQVNDLIRACQNRYVGLPGAQQEIAIAVRELRLAISDRQKFLVCMKSHMFFGLQQFQAVFSSLANSVALYNNLKKMLGPGGDLWSMVRQLDMASIFGDASALGVIIKGLKCLIVNCDSPVLSSIAVECLERIESEVPDATSKSVNMKTFDGAPRVAAKVANNRRLQKILDLIDTLNKLMNMDLEKICTDSEKMKRQQMRENLTDAENAPVNASSAKFYQYDGRQNQVKAFSSVPLPSE